MKLSELKQRVDQAFEQCTKGHRNPEDITVYIPTYKVGTVGHRPCTGVTYANMGLDWEASSFIITPEHELREIDRDEIKTLRDKCEKLGWTQYKISKIKKENEQLKAEVDRLKSEAKFTQAEAESPREAARQATGYVQR